MGTKIERHEMARAQITSLVESYKALDTEFENEEGIDLQQACVELKGGGSSHITEMADDTIDMIVYWLRVLGDETGSALFAKVGVRLTKYWDVDSVASEIQDIDDEVFDRR